MKYIYLFAIITQLILPITSANPIEKKKTVKPANSSQIDQPAKVTVTPKVGKNHKKNNATNLNQKIRNLELLKKKIKEEEKRLDEKFQQQKEYFKKFKRVKRKLRKLRRLKKLKKKHLYKNNVFKFAKDNIIDKTKAFSNEISGNFKKLAAHLYDWKNILNTIGKQHLNQEGNLIDIL